MIQYPRAATKPPRKSEPVSPIKVLAGFQFQQRKPQTPPRSAPERIPKPANCWKKEIAIKQIATVAVTEEQSPSIPSDKFTEFVHP